MSERSPEEHNRKSDVSPDAARPPRALVSRSTTRTELVTLASHAIKLPVGLRSHQSFFRFLVRSVNDKRVMQAIREIRDSLLRATISQKTSSQGQIILLSGVKGGEGASWLSLMLGLSLGGLSYRRVAWIDASFQQERFEALVKVLHLHRSDFSWSNGLDKIRGYANQAQPNTFFLGAEELANGVSFFSNKRISSFLEKLRMEFDYTIIDSGPMLSDSTQVFLAPQVDQLYLVAGAGKTRAADLERCTKIAGEENVQINGVILNQQKLPLLTRLFCKRYFY